MENRRPDPDALLMAIQKEEAWQKRGKLKIFFGMVAGVGKTYAMLEAARQRLAEGQSVVVGWADTHGRAETEALLIDLPLIPRQKLEYRGLFFEEMNLDAILACRPGLVLVDELAHTNIPGSRHRKRYQDVTELLEAGINVYTTLNVQHLESRADTVRQITGVTVHETVPDSILELADEIELIDLPPEALLKRLVEGKVYVPDQAEVAAQKFFRLGNLNALREMALRFTAEYVDKKLQDYMLVKHIAGPWKSGERLMVAIGPSPFSERLIRWTRRMAYSLEAPWLAVYVEGTRPLSVEAQAQLDRNINLARELGAELVMTTGEKVSEALIRVARQRNVAQIVVGKSQRHSISEWFGGSLVDQLIRRSGSIDVYVVTAEKNENRSQPFRPRPRLETGLRQYLVALLTVGCVTMLNLLLLPLLDYHAIGFIFLFTVLVLAVFVGRGPISVAAAVSALLWNSLFIPPRFTFVISNVADVMMFGMYFVEALILGNFAARLKEQERAARYRENYTDTLYALTRDIARANGLTEILDASVHHLGRLFEADIVVLPAANGRLSSQVHAGGTFIPAEKDLSVASWVFDHRRPAGRFTDTLAAAEALYLPLLVPSGIVGVIGLRRAHPLAQDALLTTCLKQVALAIEREFLDEAATQNKMLAESEKLYKTLLNSISHELRTPITAITGAAGSLLDPHITQTEIRLALAQEIQEAGLRLNRLVENLLDMTRLESGRLKLNRDWGDVSDLISVTLKQMKPKLARHELIIDVASNLPLVQFDFVLLEQALHNVLDNAVTYTPAGTRLRLTARTEGAELVISVADRGPGLSAETLEHIFDKFYRAPGSAAGGIGLGLSISRGLVEAHGGTLTAENRTHGGARFIIRLPLGKPPDYTLAPEIKE